MRLAPVAVFVLIAATVARSGFGLLDQLLTFALVAVVALGVHVALVLFPALRFGARLGVIGFVRATSDAMYSPRPMPWIALAVALAARPNG